MNSSSRIRCALVAPTEISPHPLRNTLKTCPHYDFLGHIGALSDMQTFFGQQDVDLVFLDLDSAHFANALLLPLFPSTTSIILVSKDYSTLLEASLHCDLDHRFLACCSPFSDKSFVTQVAIKYHYRALPMPKLRKGGKGSVLWAMDQKTPHPIDLIDILYISWREGKSRIHTPDCPRGYECHMSLKEIATALSDHPEFERVSKQYIVHTGNVPFVNNLYLPASSAPIVPSRAVLYRKRKHLKRA